MITNLLTAYGAGSSQPTPPTPTDYLHMPLCIEDISGNANTLTFVRNGGTAVTVQYSTDNVTWVTLGTVNNPLTYVIPANGKVYLRADTTKWGGTSYTAKTYMYTSEIADVYGNIMSLLYGENFTGDETSMRSSAGYTFNDIFMNSKFVHANNLFFPAVTLYSYDYRAVFDNNDYLIVGPGKDNFPIIQRGGGSSHLGGFYQACDSLEYVEVPVLQSYGNNCLEFFVNSCISLNEIKVFFTSWPSSSLGYWVGGINKTTGTFTCPTGLPEMHNGSAGSNDPYAPYGWTFNYYSE